MKVLIAGGGIGGLVRALGLHRVGIDAEQVMQIVEERAPQGFTDLDAVITPHELAEIANRYKQLAGFDRDRLNQAGAASPQRTL